MTRPVRAVLATVALGAAVLLAQAASWAIDADLWWLAAGAALGMWVAVAIAVLLIMSAVRRGGAR
jgi:predicted ferric reductase